MRGAPFGYSYDRTSRALLRHYERSMPGSCSLAIWKIREKTFGTEGLRGPEPGFDVLYQGFIARSRARLGLLPFSQGGCLKPQLDAAARCEWPVRMRSQVAVRPSRHDGGQRSEYRSEAHSKKMRRELTSPGFLPPRCNRLTSSTRYSFPSARRRFSI